MLDESKNWTEHVSTPEVIRLLKQNRDICEESIRYLDQQGYICERMAFPRELLNKYHLYAHLRKHDRCQKCASAEKILKKSKAKGK